jgi:DNA-binding response OmpR family regulator
MHIDHTRVLVIDDNAPHSEMLASYLASRDYDVQTCARVEHDDDVLAHWRPHVLVLVPSEEGQRHHELEVLRRKHPRLPVVVLTGDDTFDLLLDVEAFAPALPVALLGDLDRLESAVAAASAL